MKKYKISIKKNKIERENALISAGYITNVIYLVKWAIIFICFKY